jgi:hypothetical protein
MEADIFEKVVKRISTTINEFDLVEDYRELLLSVVLRSARLYQARITHKLPAILLPELWCIGLGGDGNQVIGITAAWFLLQLAAYWLDKVEDQEWENTSLASLDPGTISNLVTGMIFLAQLILNRLEKDDGIDSSTASELRITFSVSILSVCGGQHNDLTAPLCRLDDVLRNFEKKSGDFFALACYAGARLATADPLQLNACQDYGKNLGVLLQIADEREDLIGDQPDEWKRSVIYNAYHHEVLESGFIKKSTDLNDAAHSFRSGLQVYLSVQSRSFSHLGMAAIRRINTDLSTKSDLIQLLSQSVSLPV